jgi:mannose-1-phosphate guanylyltransferase
MTIIFFMTRVAVIMAGGSGERFWPLSRKLRPKQLLRLTDPEKTMLQEAVDRISPLVGQENVYIATATHLENPIRAAGIVPDSNVIAEPDKRNTLGCLSWVAATFLARGMIDVSVAILTADHVIENPEKFQHTVGRALGLAEETGGLVTMGITPTRPEIGYGYIESGAKFNEFAQSVTCYREKPDLETAKGFLAAGNFYWNSGMFFWTQNAFFKELCDTQPEAVQLIHLMVSAIKGGDTDKAVDEFRNIPNISIDYALMEKASRVYVVKAEFPWDDVGSFDSLFRTMPLDEHGNVTIGNVTYTDCTGCIFYNDSSRGALTAVGLSNMILVQTDDVVLAAPSTDAQRVKELVALMKDSSYL